MRRWTALALGCTLLGCTFAPSEAMSVSRACPYEKLRAPYERDTLLKFFSSRPLAVVGRGMDFLAAYRRAVELWDTPGSSELTRGELLRQEIAALGPVAVKVCRTLSLCFRTLSLCFRARLCRPLTPRTRRQARRPPTPEALPPLLLPWNLAQVGGMEGGGGAFGCVERGGIRTGVRSGSG